jgi:hypothetical protein
MLDNNNQDNGEPEIKIIEEQQIIKDDTLIGDVKRTLSKMAGSVGLNKAAKKLDPDTVVNFRESSINTNQIKVTESTPDNGMDFSVRLTESLARVSRELPLNMQVVGEKAESPKFEKVVVENDAIETITKYFKESSAERGGLLVGLFCTDSNGHEFTLISGFIPNTKGVSSWGSVRFTDDSWADMNLRLDLENEIREEKLMIVGWAHSNSSDSAVAPQSLEEDGYGDRFIIKNYFSNPKFVSVIFGNGGTYDNEYSMWRVNSEGTKVVRQKGFEICNSKGDAIYGYYKDIDEIDL